MSSLKDQIINKVDNIYDTKQAIKRAIEDKGQTIEDDLSFYSYADKIRQITAMEGVVKLFETEEEMHLDSTAKEGDLAVVYKNNLHNMISSEQVKVLSFPESVTLSSAVTDGVGCSLVSSDGSIIAVYLYESYFSFDSNMGRGFDIRYESSDGIHFIRNSFSYNSNNLSNPVYLDESYSVKNQENWDDRFGYFIQVTDIDFGGLYKYSGYSDNNYLDFPYRFSLSGETINCEYSSPLYIKDIQETLYNIVEQEFGEGLYDLNIHFKDFGLDGNPTKCTIIQGIGNGVTIRYCSDDNKFYLSEHSTHTGSYTKQLTLIEVDLVNKQSLGKSTKSYTTTEYPSGTSSMNYAYNFEEIVYDDIYASLRLYVGGTSWKYSWIAYYISAKYNTNIFGSDFRARYSTLYKYQIAPSQLTLTSSNQLLSDVKAYGKNGNITGTMPDNGELNYTPSDEEQTIPAGYTGGGSVAPISSSAIPNLVPENVVYGKQILDVVGITPDGSDFELVTKTNIEAIQATTSPGKEFSNHPYFTNTIIVDSNGEPLGGFMAKGSTVYTFGWNGTDFVNKKTYSTSSLGIDSINEDAVYASNPDKNMSGIVGFICGSSHYVYFLTYEVKYTIENGVMCPSLEISNKKGKWRIYDTSVITTQVNFLAFNPWDKTSCVCHGSNKKDVFIKLNEPTTFDSYTDCSTVQYTRSSNAMLNLNSKGHFAKNGEVFYVRENSQDTQSDVYYLTNNGLPTKKNNLGLILISGDGLNGINYNGNKVTLSYSDDGTVSINTGERIEGFQTNRLNMYGIGSITNKVFVVTNGEWTPVVFYDIDWDNNIATKFGSFTPVEGKDFGYLDQHSLEDCGQNALLGACTNPKGYDYTAYPRMIFVNRNLDEITAIKYKGELYYPNTLDSIEYQQALQTAKEIKGNK